MVHHPIRRLMPLVLCALVLTTAAFAVEATPTPNGAPIAQDQCFETYKNVAYVGQFTATDPEGDAVTFQLVDKPARGSVELAMDGTGQFTYTPYENKTGKDKFTFVAVDAQGNVSQPATAEVRIRKAKTKVTYADMSGEASYNAAIRLAEEKVMIGEQVGGTYYFHPDEPVSRSQFITMAMSALGEEPLDAVTTTGFADDAAIPTWCKGYVSAALQSGIVQGYADDTGRVVFAPENGVTRGEAAVVINRMLGVTDVAVTTFYPDTAAAPAWAFQAAVNLETAGVMSPDATGALALEEPLTRGQAAMLLASAMEVAEERETTGWFNF